MPTPTAPRNIPWRPLTVLAVCALALYLRLDYLARHTLMGDEVLQIEQMHGSFLELLRAQRLFSYLSGDYYLTFPFFKMFAYNKWGLAIPHIISTLLGFQLLYLICRRYLKTTFGFLITFLVVCFNQTMIIHSTEIRPYAVLPTLALASFYLLSCYMHSPSTRPAGNPWLLTVVLIITALFHVYGPIMIICSLIFLLLEHRRDHDFRDILSRTSRTLLTVLAVCLPIYAISLAAPHIPWQRSDVSTNMFIPYPWENMVGFLKSIFGNLVGNRSFYILLPGVVIPWILPAGTRGTQLRFLAVMVLLPVGIIYGTDLSQHFYFVQRQFIWVMPFFALFLGWVWEGALLLFFKPKDRS